MERYLVYLVYTEPRYQVARARLTTVMEVLNHLSKPSLRLLTLAQQYKVDAGE